MEDDDPPRKATRRGTDTEQLLDEIRASDSHARPDRDLALLARSELRSVRLQLEYLKPELQLEDVGVIHTIVVFGSTRLLDPETAREQLERAAPGDEAEHERARAAVERSHYYEVGRELGRLVGRCGTGSEDHRLIVMTGGGPGGMEAANRGAHEVGAKSVALNIVLPFEQLPNPYVTPELSFQFQYFAIRKMHFLLRAKALVVLPGGFGTLDELFETLTLIQTHRVPRVPVLLLGRPF